MVRCDLQQPTNTEVDLTSIDIIVKPYWAPIGAHRFLQLVREQYYDGVAFNRAVPGFLTQFGIAKDYELRSKWDSMQILDDTTFEKFKPISFAGSGEDSRTTEIFIVMPNVEQRQLDYFGENSWETPFAYISGRILKDLANGFIPTTGICHLGGKALILQEYMMKMDMTTLNRDFLTSGTLIVAMLYRRSRD